jgi:hypothetical protein
MIEGIVAPWILGKAPGRTMLEPLIHWQDDQFARPGKLAGPQQARNIRSCPRIVAAIPAQNLLNPISHA